MSVSVFFYKIALSLVVFVFSFEADAFCVHFNGMSVALVGFIYTPVFAPIGIVDDEFAFHFTVFEHSFHHVACFFSKFSFSVPDILFPATNVDVAVFLPAPTHAFIGGSAGSLRGIVECLLQKNPNVRIVANAVTLESVAELSEIAKDFPDPDICQISVSRARRLGRYNLMTAQNPVYIFALQRGAADLKEKDE